MFRGIAQSDLWTEIDPVQEGFSGDEKFHVSGPGGECLLRISPADKRERRLREYTAMRALAPLSVNIPRALDFGDCEGGVYTLLSWVEGRPSPEILPGLPAHGQRAVGRQAGAILRALHTVPAPLAPDWAEAYGRKMARKVESYRACALHLPELDEFAAYALDSAALLSGRPSTFQHGDYSVANMVLDASFRLGVIDFDRMDYGDPWEEFNRIVWSAQLSPAFARGTVDGYFDGAPPLAFWKLLALYIASNTLGSLPWAVPFGEEQMDIMREQAAQVLDWYDGMENPVPRWYRA